MMRAILLVLGIFWTSLVQAEGLMIITSPQVPDAAISIKQLADIYTLKKTFWADKTLVVPVNREASSNERERFSLDVFNLSPRELSEYLDRLRFQGKLPPVVQTSDQAVLGFVRSVPGAIGYISADQPPAGVKVLLWLP
jgi:ABC-type phosphate transport system substrate-binding protein